MRRVAIVAAVAAIFGTASCGDGSSYLLVTVTSGAPLTVTSLEVTLTNAGQHATVSITRGTSFTIPPDDTFVLKLDPTRHGDVAVDVRARMGDTELAAATTRTTIVKGDTASFTLMLAPAIADMAGSDGQDQAMPDVFMPDLAFSPDLMLQPDLTPPAPDLAVAPDLMPPAPTCSDGIMNGTETDVDCGGSCGRCVNGKMCRTNCDCVSANCFGTVCVVPAKLSFMKTELPVGQYPLGAAPF